MENPVLQLGTIYGIIDLLKGQMMTQFGKISYEPLNQRPTPIPRLLLVLSAMTLIDVTMAICFTMDVAESLWIQFYFYLGLSAATVIVAALAMLCRRIRRIPLLFVVIIAGACGYIKCMSLLRIIADAKSHGYL